MIAGTFLAAIEGILSPVVGRPADRRGTIPPITISLIAAIAVSLLAGACLATLVTIQVRRRRKERSPS